MGWAKCGGNFNKFDTFLKASTSNSCVCESSKEGTKLKDNHCFGIVETLVREELDIRILIRQELCAHIVAKREILKQNSMDDYLWTMTAWNIFWNNMFLQVHTYPTGKFKFFPIPDILGN